MNAPGRLELCAPALAVAFAGAYGVFAAAVPRSVIADWEKRSNGQDHSGMADGVTPTSTVGVTDDFTPAPAGPVTTTDEVDGYEVPLDGDLAVGSMSELTAWVTRGGRPVTTLQPYLGAFGHLVALRVGDLAYTRVHPQGSYPKPGDTAGPHITFAAEAPTAGRYLLYLDFRIDGQVHTAEFVLDAARGGDGTHMNDMDSHGH